MPVEKKGREESSLGEGWGKGSTRPVTIPHTSTAFIVMMLMMDTNLPSLKKHTHLIHSIVNLFK